MAAAVTVTRFHVVHRIAAALLGGYAFCWGLIALGVASLFPLGLDFHDAESLSNIVALLAFVIVFCWAFMARSLPKVWLILAGGGAAMAAVASLLQSTQL